MGLNKFLSGTANISATAASVASKAKSALGALENKVQSLSATGSLKQLGSLVRSRNVIDAANGAAAAEPKAATFADSGRDWRVRLSMPNNFVGSKLLTPLEETNGFVFPYTPQITVNHSANYQTMEPAHNNYPFFAYQHSRVESMTIVGQFYLEDSVEARYWIGAVHYLRSVTKMAYGNTSNTGAPPPVVRLNGYGDFVFNNVPVIVTSFTIDLPNDVDYISTGVAGEAPVDTFTGEELEPLESVGWAPVKSSITVVVQPIYSREEVRRFSLDSFIKGDYVIGDKKGSGYI